MILLREITGNLENMSYSERNLEKYLTNKEDVKKLLRLSSLYTSVIKKINQIHGSEYKISLNQVNKVIEQLKKDISTLSQSQIEIAKQKVVISNTINQKCSNYFMKEITELLDQEDALNTKLRSSNRKLLNAKSSLQMWTVQKEELQNQRKRILIEVDSEIQIIKQLIDQIDSANILKVNLEEIEKHLDQNMVLKFPLPNKRKIYVKMFMRALKEEISILQNIYPLAQEFVQKTSRENDYDVSELIDRNNQIIFFYSLHPIMIEDLIKINEYSSKRFKDKKDNQIIDKTIEEYLIKQNLYDQIYQYINNIPSYKINSNEERQTFENIIESLGQIAEILNIKNKQENNVEISKILKREIEPEQITKIKQIERLQNAFSLLHGFKRTNNFSEENYTLEPLEEVDIFDQSYTHKK